MNYRMIAYVLSRLLGIECLFMLPAAAISYFQGEGSSVSAFIAAICIMLMAAGLLALFKPRKKAIYAREGFVVVALAWILMSLFGCLPFYISGYIPHFVDAFFEIVSGFTTTGSTILTDVEILPMGLLYWRRFTHWVGGMGVLVFLLAIVPMAKGEGSTIHILKAESPGPVVGKLVPRMHQSAKILYSIYIVMTIVEIILLLLGGMPLFDSVLHSFGTAGTGGFGIKNASLAAYDSYYLQSVITVFMALFGVNFNIFYFLLIKEYSQALHNEELRLYFGIMFASIAAITWNILPTYGGSFRDALHHAAFQVSSVMTTTGYATANFDLWPEFSRLILLLLMFIGASAGSTGGGIKVARLLILIKSAARDIRSLLSPRTVKVAKMDGKVLDDQVIRSVDVYMICYFLIFGFSMLFISVDNFSMTTTISAVASCLNNIGPGLDIVGPVGNFSQFSDFSKLVLTADMLIGRLEIFPILFLFAPSVWRQKQKTAEIAGSYREATSNIDL